MPKSRLKKMIEKRIAMFFNKVMGSGLAQEENTADGSRYITPGMPEKLRQLAQEGIVLLENDGTLPIAAGKKVSVFGRVSHDWFYVGYGSGGDVHAPYEVKFYEGLSNAGISYNESLKIYMMNGAPKRKTKRITDIGDTGRIIMRKCRLVMIS